MRYPGRPNKAPKQGTPTFRPEFRQNGSGHQKRAGMLQKTPYLNPVVILQ